MYILENGIENNIDVDDFQLNSLYYNNAKAHRSQSSKLIVDITEFPVFEFEVSLFNQKNSY